MGMLFESIKNDETNDHAFGDDIQLTESSEISEEKSQQDFDLEIKLSLNPFDRQSVKIQKKLSDELLGNIGFSRVGNREMLEPTVVYPNKSEKFHIEKDYASNKGYTFRLDQQLNYDFLKMEDRDVDYNTRRKQFPLGTPKLFYKDTYIEGWPRQNAKYVVLASSTVVLSEYHAKYAFYLPLSGFMWKHFNFGAVCVLTGPSEIWFEDKLHQRVVQELRKLKDVVLVYLNSTTTNMVTVAQTSRLFVPGNIFYNQHLDDTYFITADSDFWPLTERNHSLHFPGQEIAVTRVLSGRRWNCHATALSCIGAKSKTWRELTNSHDSVLEKYKQPWRTTGFKVKMLWKEPRPIVKNAEELLNFLSKAVGNETARTKVLRGHAPTKDTWFLDQTLFDSYIKTWVEKHGGDEGYKKVFWGKKGLGGENRVSRGRGWDKGIRNMKLNIVQDAHMPGQVYAGNQWVTVKHLFRVVFKRDFFYREDQQEKLLKDVSLFDRYQKEFEGILIDDFCGDRKYKHAAPGMLRNCTLWKSFRNNVDIGRTNITLENAIWWYSKKIEKDSNSDLTWIGDDKGRSIFHPHK